MRYTGINFLFTYFLYIIKLFYYYLYNLCYYVSYIIYIIYIIIYYFIYYIYYLLLFWSFVSALRKHCGITLKNCNGFIRKTKCKTFFMHAIFEFNKYFSELFVTHVSHPQSKLCLLVRGFFAVGQFAVGQFAVKKISFS